MDGRGLSASAWVIPSPMSVPPPPSSSTWEARLTRFTECTCASHDKHADVCSPQPNSLQEGFHFCQDSGEEVAGHRTRCVADDGDVGYRALEGRHDHRGRRLRPP